MNNIIGEKVSVYYNLHKHCFSVKHNNKVVGYCNYVKLKYVKFTVRNSGRLNVIRTKQKNVHAFVSGILEDYNSKCEFIEESEFNKVMYDPYKFSTFVFDLTKKPITNANEVILNNDINKIYIKKYEI